MEFCEDKKLQIDLNSWNNKIVEKRLPRWNELPEFEVYMDQVIMLMEKYVGVYFEYTDDTFLTPAMINNYVKLKIMPAPENKKYSRIHLSYLIIICMLKSVMPIQDIHDIIEYKLAEENMEATLNWFSKTCEEQFTVFFNNTKQLLKSNEEKVEDDKVNLSNAAFRMGIEASIARNISSTLIYKVKKENASLQTEKTSKTKNNK